MTAFCQIQMSLKPQPVKDRLRQADADIVQRGLRPQQRLEHCTGIATFAGDGDAGQELRAGILDIGIGGGEQGFGLTDVGALCQKLGRQPGRHTRIRNTA